MKYDNIGHNLNRAKMEYWNTGIMECRNHWSNGMVE
jgi:hypothetical protein